MFNYENRPNHKSLLQQRKCHKKRQKMKLKQENAPDSVSFKNYNPSGAHRIEQELARKGIQCNFEGNEFLGECIKKVTELFEGLFGRSWLPEKIGMEHMRPGTYAAYLYTDNSVSINSYHNNECYDNIENLKQKVKENHNNKLLSNWFSSAHPAHIFAHEYSHCAHWHNLVDRNGYYNAAKVWHGLDEVTVPTSIGRLITRFKLSDYAVEGDDMCEFIAERASKDICNNITDNMWIPYKSIDVGYSNIFNRKWNYRYSTPQSYIDYFTQQVWNGDIDEAIRTGEMVEQYLSELDAERVSPIVSTVDRATQSLGLGFIGRGLSALNERLTDHLDKKNKTRLN